jgi:hypothetical protein
LLGQCSGGLRAGWPGFDSLQCKIFFFSTMARPTLGPTQPPIHWGLGAFSPRAKWQECETDHSPPSNAEVKKVGATPPLSHVFMA